MAGRRRAEPTTGAHAASAEVEDGGPRSIHRLLAALSLLSQGREGLSLAELSQELQVPKSSLLNLLRPLVGQDFLLLHNNIYTLGPGAFHLAARIMARWSNIDNLRPYLDELSRLTQETISLGVLDGDARRVVFTHVIDSPHPLRYVVVPGSSAPLYCTAAGRVFLAFGAAQWREDYLANTMFKQYTPDTVTSIPKLRAILEGVRERGMATSVGELLSGTSALAAPVFGLDGGLVAALVLSAPAERAEDRFAEFSQTLRAVAARASGIASAP